MAVKPSVRRNTGDKSLTLSLCLVMALASPAGAQGTDQAGAPQAAAEGLQDIVVTARRRQEASQVVPVAITAFSQEGLNERRIMTGQDLQGQVPSLTVGSVGQSRATESFTLRGQGTTFLSAPGVVNYFAEAPLVPGTYVSTQGPPGMLLDLANVQVLRGPQGTLFGRNTTGGAILLEPARPTDKVEGYVQGQIGNYADREVEAVVNLPVIDDKLLVRVAGRFVDRDGFTKDVETGRDYDDRHYFTGRIGVTFRPVDGVENYLVAFGSKSRTHGSGFVIDGFNTGLLDARFAARGGCAGVGLGANCSVLSDLAAAQRERGTRRVAGLGESYTRIKGWGVHDILSIELSDTLTLRNIASYGELKTNLALDQDGTAIDIYNVTDATPFPVDKTWQWSEELQLQGTAWDETLQYTVGLYADQSKSDGLQGQRNRTSLTEVFQLRGFGRKSHAAYLQGTYDVGGLVPALTGLSLTGGIRRTWDRSSGFGAAYRFNPDGSVACTNGANPTPSAPLDCTASSRTKSAATTWTVGADYKVARQILLYGKVSRGYKTGGVNYSAVNTDNFTYEPEVVTTYEAGVKSDFRLADVPVRLNATVFSTEYDNIQRTAGDFNFQTLASGAIVINAASATIRGVELEGRVEPVRGIVLSGNYSYLDAEYGSYIFPAVGPTLDCSGAVRTGPVDLSCMPFQFTPKHQFSANGTIDIPMPEGAGDLNLSITYAYTGRQYSSTGTLPAAEPGAYLESYGLTNASLNWRNAFERPVDLSLFVTNAFGKSYRISNSNVFNSLGVQSSLYGEPRMYGVQLRYRWGG